MADDVRKLLTEDPEKARARVLEYLKTNTLKALAEHLDVPYPTLHRICRDLGLKGLGASFLNAITSEEWATLSKRQLSLKYLLSYSHVYNFYTYHKERIEDGIRKWKLENTPTQTAPAPSGDDRSESS